jgi:arylsulfatase A-like enzyme
MPDRPNVLWIMADQHSARCTSWGDYPTDVHTPNLERLASEGTRFDSAYCQNPICTPSRTSYLTGQYPSNHGYYAITGFRPDLEHPIPNCFEVMDRAGYRTGVFGKVHTPEGLIEPSLDRRRDHGHYTEYLEGRGTLSTYEESPLKLPGGGQATDAQPSDQVYEDHYEHWATRCAQDFIGDGDDPFFAWLSFSRPHQLYAPAQRFWDLYPEEADIDLPPSVHEDLEAAGKPPHQSPPDLDEQSPAAVFEPSDHESVLRRKVRGYLGCVTEVDDLVGQMLDYLEAQGLREDTIVIYCADHGDFAAEHRFSEKAPGISYDAITRVPYIWSWPGQVEEGRVVEDLVETVDFFPTLCDLLGIDAPDSADGHSLTDALAGDGIDDTREYVVTENPWARCVRTDSQKLTVYPSGFYGEGSERFLEFYDLEDDPWEMENLAETAPDANREAIQRHQGLLYDFLATHRRARSVMPHLDVDDTLAEDGTVPPSLVQEFLNDDSFSRNYM